MLDSGQLKRWSAMDGKNIDLAADEKVSLLCKNNIKRKWRRAHEEINSVGAIGCAYSHISLWKWLVDSSHDVLLVFEDDAKVPADFVQKLQMAIDNSQILRTGDYDIVVPATTASTSIIPSERFVKKVNFFMCTQFYIITKTCARRFLAEVYPITEHIDLWICLFNLVRGIKMFCINPVWLEVRQNNSTSDITSVDYCPLCNIGVDFYQSGRLVPIWDYWTIRLAEAGLGGLGLWMLWKTYGKTK